MTATVIGPARNLGLQAGTKIGGDMTKKRTLQPEPGQPWLTLTDVARIWTEERAAADTAQAIAKGEEPPPVRPVSRATVVSYMKRYRTGNARYGGNPMPKATYPDPSMPPPGQQPLWVPGPGETIADVEQRLRDWWNGRVGAGARTDLPPKVPAQPVPCACGSGAKVAPGTTCDECVKYSPGR